MRTMDRIEQLLLLEAMILLIIMPWNHRRLVAQASWALPNCPNKCGDIIVPFPFGMGLGCFLPGGYEMVCEGVPQPSKLTMKALSPPYNQVLSISVANRTMTISYPLVVQTNTTSTGIDTGFIPTTSPVFKPGFHGDLMPSSNISAPITVNWYVRTSLRDTGGINCTTNSVRRCSSVTSYQDSFITYDGKCNEGYQGNPYTDNGCEDINECDDSMVKLMCPNCQNLPGSYNCGPPATNWKGIITGISAGVGVLVSFLFVCWHLRKIIQKKQKIRVKEKYFLDLLLKQHLSLLESNTENRKLFNLKELEKATDGFNDDRILGRGGSGTVYKGMLTNGRIVAVKKSKSIDEGNIKNFINEVFILTNINHRNVVKLLGCCLQTEVPILVYEFVSNGTLYQYIHNTNEELQLTWEIHLQLAIEIAGALSYLHSAASIPIYHRDIKSTNILLDDKYRAKVADFGTSKLMALDQTHLITKVQGTFGYLDPEYFQSGKFTDKSDVYSFGIILVELLTGKKPISSSETNEEMCGSLAKYFVDCLKANQLFAIVDDHVLSQARKEEIMTFADLARKCLSLSGKNRPNMKEVALELESIRQLSRQHSMGHENQDNEGYVCLKGEDGENLSMASITSF